MEKSDGVQRATARGRDEWFELLDAWGAAGRPYREIADWLTSEHDLSRWWTQKLIVEYEQERGLRPPGLRPDGTFAVTTSKTVAVPVTRLFDAFANPRLRERWLPGAVMRERTSQRGRSRHMGKSPPEARRHPCRRLAPQAPGDRRHRERLGLDSRPS